MQDIREIINLIEAKSKCKTPGANYTFKSGDRKFTSIVTLPFDVELSESQVKKLEDELHDALEGVFKQFFKK